VGSAIWSIFTARRYVERGICRRRVSIGFVLTIASRGPSAIAELLVNFGVPSISQEWPKLELSNLLQRETISSLAKGMTNHP